MAPPNSAPITPVPLPNWVMARTTTTTGTPTGTGSTTSPGTKEAYQSHEAYGQSGGKKRIADGQPGQARDAKRQSAGLALETSFGSAQDAANADGVSTSIMTPYSVWKDGDGTIESTHGALLPEGYRKSHPPCPWSCPIDTCSLSYRSLRGLGIHFSNDHKGLLLRDTHKGTWEVRGHHPHGLENAPSTVMPEVAPEVLTVSLSPTTRIIIDLIEKFCQSARHKLTAPIRSLLISGQFKRDLPPEWVSAFKNKKDVPPKAMLAALVYITGDPLPEGCAECKTSTKATRKSCIIQLDALYDISSDDKDLSAACASCVLYSAVARQKLRCSLIPSQQSSKPSTFHSPAEESHISLRSLRNIPNHTTSSERSDSQRGARNSTTEIRYIYEEKKESQPNTRHASSSLVRDSIEPEEARDIYEEKEESQPRGRHESRPRARESIEPEEVWEVAPGRATADMGHGATTVAFSASYLKSMYPLALDNSLLANNIELGVGKKHTWKEKGDRTRLCTIIRGKVCVRLAGSSILIKEGGIFKVPMSISCEVENVGSGALLSVITALEPGAVSWEDEAQDHDDGY